MPKVTSVTERLAALADSGLVAVVSNDPGILARVVTSTLALATDADG